MAEFKLKVPDMSCEHCEKRIREAVSNAGGRVKSLDLKSKRSSSISRLRPTSF